MPRRKAPDARSREEVLPFRSTPRRATKEPPMGFMTGKRGLVTGVLHETSIATSITQSLLREGAECIFTHMPGEKMERRTRKIVEGFGVANPWLQPMDVAQDADIAACFERVGKDFGQIDFIVHSIAFADKDWLKLGKFAATPRSVFLNAMDISAFSYMAMGNAALPYLKDGASMVGLSYYGAEKAVPGYNVMGVAKAALEATNRYLAMELGRAKNVRANLVSAGPIKTLSASAVGGFDSILDRIPQVAPLPRNIVAAEVGDAAAFLLSDLSRGTTGQVLYVDSGYSIMGL
jgi:enoyl-[acyl-carrier protein] reductase I